MRCQCGFVNDPGARFCGKCGVALEAGPSTSHPATNPVPEAPTRRRPWSRGQVVVLALVVAVAGAGYWWMNRPPGAYRPDNGGFFSTMVDGKVGFTDKSGKVVIAAEFGESSGFSEGLAGVLVGNKYGFIDKNGKLVITPQFDYALPFRFGRAAVKLCCGNDWSAQGPQHKFGFIDTDGKYISAPDFAWVGNFSGDLAPVRTSQGPNAGGIAIHGNAFLNRAGQLVLTGKFRAVGSFSEGLAPASVDGPWGYIDPAGEWGIKPQFEYAFGFVDGLAPVQVGGKAGYIDRSGRFAINPQYENAQEFSEGRATVQTTDNAAIAVIDRTGRTIVPAGKYDHVQAYSEGRAVVTSAQGLHGFIDLSGAEVVPPQFDWAGPFQNGLAPVSALGKLGFITPAGSFAIDPFPGSSLKQEIARLAEEAQKAEENAVAEQAGLVAATSKRIAGSWRGLMTQPGIPDSPIIDEFYSFSPGGTCGRFDYPGLGCSGTFICSEMLQNIYVVGQAIEIGQDRCTAGTNRIEAQSDGTLLWIWVDPRTGREGARGTLTRAGEVARVGAQPATEGRNAGSAVQSQASPTGAQVRERLEGVSALLEQRQYQRAQAQCAAVLKEAPGNAEAAALCDRIKKTMQILGIEK